MGCTLRGIAPQERLNDVSGWKNKERKGSGMEQTAPKGKSGKRAARGRTAAHRRRKRRQFGEKQSFCDKNNRNRKKFSSQTPKSLVSENRRIYDWSTKQSSGWSMKKVLTTCGYCGCGCNLYLTVEGGRITGVLPKPDHPVSQGMLCSKGWQGHGFARHPDRLDQPLLRQEDGTLKGVSWSEAYRAIAEHSIRLRGGHQRP